MERHFTDDALEQIYAELLRISDGRDTISGGWWWPRLDAMAGRSSVGCFDEMIQLGWLEVFVIQGTWGHQQYRFKRTDLDTASSASRQHYIETGRYLRKGEAAL